MNDKPKMQLTNRESTILRDICFARMKVLHAGDSQTLEELPHQTELSENTARQSLHVFDFFRCAYFGNEEGVKRQTEKQRNMDSHSGGGYYDGITEDYHRIMAERMEAEYGLDEVVMLQNRIKGFVKSIKTAPARTLYIADCHFYHRRLNTEMDKRGFASVEEMNDHMIRRWNSKVTKNDTVYILGDLSLAGGFQTSGILERLNGKKHLIIGNHDKRYLDDKFFEDHQLRSRKQYAEIRDNGRNVILSHYPVFCYKGQYRRDKDGRPLTYMLYGHVHNTHDEALINRFIMETRATKVMSRHSTEPAPIPCNMINCFCMFSDYQPMTLDEWIEIDRKRRKTMGAETTLSAASLAMMNSAIENYKRGIVSEPIDLGNDFEGE